MAAPAPRQAERRGQSGGSIALCPEPAAAAAAPAPRGRRRARCGQRSAPPLGGAPAPQGTRGAARAALRLRRGRRGSLSPPARSPAPLRHGAQLPPRTLPPLLPLRSAERAERARPGGLRRGRAVPPPAPVRSAPAAGTCPSPPPGPAPGWRARRDRAEQSRAGQGRAEQGRAGPAPAAPSRAEPSLARPRVTLLGWSRSEIAVVASRRSWRFRRF